MVLAMSGCYHRESTTPDGFMPTEEQMDSISFSTTHHYSENYNFIVTADSLRLMAVVPPDGHVPEGSDTIVVLSGDRLVVSDIVTLHEAEDSVWVQLVRDESTVGWVSESEMLKRVSPDNFISRFIDFFQDTHLLIMLAIVVLCLAAFVVARLYRHNARIVHFRDIDSFYPTLLALLVAAAAVFYSSIQLVAPDSWRHFYYHPTLNPFAVPLHLMLFLFSFWAIVIMTLATLDDVRRHLPFGQAVLYVIGMAAVCSVNYVVFSVSTLYYVGYPLLLIYIAAAVYAYFRYSRARFICGNCGHPIRQKGLCPYCGARNV
jgi:hypothetical protein